MSTMMICPTCGGIKVGPGGSAAGRRCNCPSGVSSLEAISIASKICCVCGIDVTDKKRMKDGVSGRYWCYDCFLLEQRKKQAGMTMRCPRCNKDYPPIKMVKHDEMYWCENCAADGGKGKKKSKPDAAGAAPSSVSKDNSNGPVFVLLAVLLAAAALVYYVMI